MTELLSRLHPGDLAMVLIVGGALLAGTILGLGVRITLAIQRHREQEVASNLVLHLLDRGVPPTEIAAILQAMGLDQPAERPRSRLGRLLGGFRSPRA